MRSARIVHPKRRPPPAEWIEPVEPRLLLASISGTIYRDDNANGMRDAGESSAVDWAAFIDLNDNGARDAGDPVAGFGNGSFTFTNVPAGTYRVRVDLWAGYGQSQPANNAPHVVTVTASQFVSGIDFGVVRLTTGSVAGSIYNDVDGDAQRDATDIPLGGYPILLEKANPGVLDPGEFSTVTDASGTYRFENVPIGTYTVTHTLPPSARHSGSSRSVNVIGGRTATPADFVFTPFQRSPYVDPSFGVGGVSTPPVTTSMPADVLELADLPGDGFYLLSIGYLHRLHDDGSPDLAFGIGGRVRTPYFGTLAADPEGRALLAYYDDNGAVVARYTSAGLLDASFGNAGVASVPFGPGTYPRGLIATADAVTLAVTAGNPRYGLARLTHQGTLDPSFNDGQGYLLSEPGDSVTTIDIGPGNTIVLAGQNKVHRRNADGSLDASFGNGGTVRLDASFTAAPDVQGFHDVLVHPEDGRILLAPSRSSKPDTFTVIRLTAAGLADTTFGGGDGVAETNFPRPAGGHAPRAHAARLARLPGGAVVAVGNARVTTTRHDDLAVARFRADGLLDLAFADGGRLVATFSANTDTLIAAFVHPGGDVVAAIRDATLGLEADPDRLVRLRPDAPPEHVTGVVFNDLDEDGLLETDEPGVAGVTVFLDDDGDGRPDPGEPATRTNTLGGYALPVPADVPQRVTLVRPDGWTIVAPAGGTRLVTVPAGRQGPDHDFALGDLVGPTVTGIDVGASADGAELVWTIRFDEPIVLSPVTSAAFRLDNLTFNRNDNFKAVSHDPIANTITLRAAPPSDGAYRFTVLAAAPLGSPLLRDLSGNAPAATATQELIFGKPAAGDQTWTLRRTAAGNVEAVRAQGAVATGPFAVPADQLDAIFIDGGEGSDTMRIDLAGGNPLVGNTIRVAAGGQFLGNDALHVLGTPGADRVAFSADAITIDGVRAAAPRYNAGYFDGRGGEDVLAVASGTVVVTGPPHFASLDIGDRGDVVARPQSGQTISTRTLTMTDTARLRLDQNDLVIHATPETRDALLAAVVTQIKLAIPNVNGIYSFPLRQYSHVAATINPGLAAFSGEPIDENAILVTATYTGDATLDGRINADDYFRIDQGFLAQPANPSYRQGDFNYDGKVNADDYFLIDQAFLGQNTALASIGASSPTTSVTSATVTTADHDVRRKTRRTAPRRSPL